MREDNNTLNGVDVVRFIENGRLFSTCSSRDALIIYLLYKTGSKPSDIAQLTVDSVDLLKKRISVRSVRKYHENMPSISVRIPSQLSLLPLLSGRYIFGKGETPLSVRRIEQIVKDILGISPRDIRKLYLQNNISPSQNINLITRLKTPQKREILSNSQLDILRGTLRSFSERDQLIIHTQLVTGLRVAELVQLHTMHIVQSGILIPKDISVSREERFIALPASLLKQLSTLNGYLFGRAGKPLTVRRFEQICVDVSSKLSFDVTPSILRSTAIHRLAKTLSLSQVQEQVGLKSDLLYTHGIVSEKPHTTSTSEVVDKEDRKDGKLEYSSSSMYRKARTKRGGGDADE